MNVSVICTVLNEGQSIRTLLDTLVAQSRHPDEVIFVDGGSSDDTVLTIESFADRLSLRVIVASGANISQGRNIAINTAAGPIIASTDAGVRLSDDWLAELMIPFESDSPPRVVAGFFEADPQSTFEVAMGATVLPMVDDIEPKTFLPSSRSVAFTKTAWKLVDGYPEWLDYCEDLVFDLKLKTIANPFTFAPKAVAHFRPRGSLKTFFRQYYLYARGDGKADLWGQRHIIRYATYLIALPMMLALAIFSSPWYLLTLVIVGGIGMFMTPYLRLTKQWDNLSAAQKAQAALWVPVIRITGDIAKMIGYPMGRVWRSKHLPDNPELRWQKKESSNR